jgi:flagellar biosynthesis protein FlhF
MEVRTYRAASMREALEMVRHDLGPDASVLHTSQSGSRLWSWLGGGSRFEVTASNSVNVPSRFPAEVRLDPRAEPNDPPRVPRADEQDFRGRFRDTLKEQDGPSYSLVEEYSLSSKSFGHDLSETLFQAYTDLIEAEVEEDLAKELIGRVRRESPAGEADDLVLLKARMARMIEDQIDVCGPISVTPGRSRIVALVGPTGVGKTTTIAKLAANYRLRERLRVGLITVDTYRIAAVEQLRTYADIIDLPMEVVSTPREMREAVTRLSNLDLVLMDTAGRSPRDDVKIQELKSLLAEARADEVHLVLSSVGGSRGLVKTAERFAEAGTTSLILTKLDEASALGNVLPLLASSRLPLSYVTNGQNVPDDIEAASRRKLARMVLGMER